MCVVATRKQSSRSTKLKANTHPARGGVVWGGRWRAFTSIVPSRIVALSHVSPPSSSILPDVPGPRARRPVGDGRPTSVACAQRWDLGPAMVLLKRATHRPRPGALRPKSTCCLRAPPSFSAWGCPWRLHPPGDTPLPLGGRTRSSHKGPDGDRRPFSFIFFFRKTYRMGPE